MNKTIAVIGLGKLGAPLAALLAAKGMNVVGVDLDSALVAAINAGTSPVQEPGLQNLIDSGRSRLRATSNTFEAVAEAEATFIVVPTPTDPGGVFSNRYVLSAISAIGQALKANRRYHLVSVVSTVMPGSMDGEIRNALERASERRVGIELGLCYNPEFIALGSVVHDMLFPDVVLIGESDTEAGDRLAAISARLCENKPAVCRMSMINAEITKLAINTFVTTKISYANMLGEICERLPGADAVTVAAAIGMDSRIGSKYLRPSVGYGGPCFPRDNLAFVTLAAKLGARADLSAATDGLNRYQVERLLQRLSGLATPPASIGILGLSYKPHTPVVEESFGVALAAACVARGYKVAVADPMALRGALDILGDGVRACDSGDECVAVSDVVFITTAWPDYSTLDLDAIAQRGRPLTIIDCWRLLDPKQLADNVEVVQIGRG